MAGVEAVAYSRGLEEGGMPVITDTDDHDEWLVSVEFVEEVADWSGQMYPMAGGMSLQQQWVGYVRTRLVFCFRWWLTRQRRQAWWSSLRRGWVVWSETTGWVGGGGWLCGNRGVGTGCTNGATI